MTYDAFPQLKLCIAHLIRTWHFQCSRLVKGAFGQISAKTVHITCRLGLQLKLPAIQIREVIKIKKRTPFITQKTQALDSTYLANLLILLDGTPHWSIVYRYLQFSNYLFRNNGDLNTFLLTGSLPTVWVSQCAASGLQLRSVELNYCIIIDQTQTEIKIKIIIKLLL